MNRDALLARIDSALARGKATVESAGPPKSPEPYPGYKHDDHWIDEALAAGFRTAGLALLQDVYGKNHYHFKDFYQETNDTRTLRHYRKAYAILEALREAIANGWLDVSSLKSATARVDSKAKRGLRPFLCHSKDDKSEVEKLHDRLTADGYDPWLDTKKLLPGQDWDTEIKKAVKASDVVIVCLSATSANKTGYVQKEIKVALDVADEQPEGRIYIIPARLDAEAIVPQRLSRWQWVNLFDEDGYKRLVASLESRAGA